MSDSDNGNIEFGPSRIIHLNRIMCAVYLIPANTSPGIHPRMPYVSSSMLARFMSISFDEIVCAVIFVAATMEIANVFAVHAYCETNRNSKIKVNLSLTLQLVHFDQGQYRRGVRKAKS